MCKWDIEIAGRQMGRVYTHIHAHTHMFNIIWLARTANSGRVLLLLLTFARRDAGDGGGGRARTQRRRRCRVSGSAFGRAANVKKGVVTERRGRHLSRRPTGGPDAATQLSSSVDRTSRLRTHARGILTCLYGHTDCVTVAATFIEFIRLKKKKITLGSL